MANKGNTGAKTIRKTTTLPESAVTWKMKWLAAGAIVIITLLAYSQSIHNYLLETVDDNAYVIYDTLLHKPTDVSKMFTTPVAGNRNGLTILSLALDYSLYGLQKADEESYNGTGYHVTNLLLHVLNGVLLFWLCLFLLPSGRQDGKIKIELKTDIATAFLVALYFAIYPTHVESVAWVSARKDLLYMLFYLGALLSYILYLSRTLTGRWGVYILSLVLFVLSLASKSQAVTLPVVLLLIDYYSRRKFDWKLIAEKAPFFLLALAGGIDTLHVQNASGAMKLHLSLALRIMYACYALLNYIFKAFIPYPLSADYPYPDANDTWIYLSPLIILFLAMVLIWRFRKDRTVMFGAAVFLVNILLILKLVPVGYVIMADRYTYLPYVGLSFIAFVKIQEYLNRNNNTLIKAAIGIYMIVLFFISYNRTSVWHDDKLYWVDVCEKYPSYGMAFGRLAQIYEKERKLDTAINYFTKDIELDRGKIYLVDNNTPVYLNRAYVYLQANLPAQTVADCDTVLKLGNGRDSLDAYSRRFKGNFMLGNTSQALSDLDNCARFAPDSAYKAAIYTDLGNIYGLNGKFDTAAIYYRLAIRADSSASALCGNNIYVFQHTKFTPGVTRLTGLSWSIPSVNSQGN